MKILGFDIGGTGIKHAFVDTDTGELLTERIKQLTPKPVIPQAVATVVREAIESYAWDGPVGFGFPARIKHSICMTAVNIEKDWVGLNVNEFFTEQTERPCFGLNDADAAGLAELHFGAGADERGRALLLTVGTGIGAALLDENRLVEGIEVFAIEMENGHTVENYLSNSTRKEKELDWEEWGTRLNEVLKYLDLVFTPDLFIIGGGIARKAEYYEEYVDPQLNWKPAELKNAAGVVGAAIWAEQKIK